MFPFSLAADPVLDTSGQPLRSGVSYYIHLASAVDGGGVTLAKGENGACPFEVVQALNANGSPLLFSPANSTDGVVHVDDDITIKFVPSDDTSGCPQSTVWQVEGLQDAVVRTGGVENGTDTSLFTIQRYEDSYALQFCPRATGCTFICPKLLCGYIGIEQVDGRRRLAVNRPPFKIVFQKLGHKLFKRYEESLTNLAKITMGLGNGSKPTNRTHDAVRLLRRAIEMVGCPRHGGDLEQIFGETSQENAEGPSMQDDENINGDACVGENEENGAYECIPDCDESIKPILGQRFSTLDEGVGYYKEYAAFVGFDVRSSIV
nr:kunitz trypsin inhibitor 2-like [Ipomoea batatas]